MNYHQASKATLLIMVDHVCSYCWELVVDRNGRKLGAQSTSHIQPGLTCYTLDWMCSRSLCSDGIAEVVVAEVGVASLQPGAFFVESTRFCHRINIPKWG